jgi:hypothetical protein
LHCGRKSLLFLKKKKQKDFCSLMMRLAFYHYGRNKGQEFFASFFHKRRLLFRAYWCGGIGLLAGHGRLVVVAMAGSATRDLAFVMRGRGVRLRCLGRRGRTGIRRGDRLGESRHREQQRAGGGKQGGLHGNTPCGL